MEEKIWEYIDGNLPETEQTAIRQLIESQAAWKEKYKELLGFSDLVKHSDLDSPSMRFTRNVMEEIARIHIAPATKTYINQKIIWGIGSFFIIMIIGILVYGFGQISFDGGNPSGLSKNLDKVDLSKFFSNTWVNVFLMINIVLGFVLLDHYLTGKRKKYQQEA
jgi:hypothetical protein